SKSKRRDDNQREAGVLPAASNGVAQILQRVFEPKKGPLLTVQFLRTFNTAESAAGRKACLTGSHAAMPELVFDKGQVRVDLVLHLAFGAATLQRGPDFLKNYSPTPHFTTPSKEAFQ